MNGYGTRHELELLLTLAIRFSRSTLPRWVMCINRYFNMSKIGLAKTGMGTFFFLCFIFTWENHSYFGEKLR